jgi:hypothetical protein
VSSKCFQLYYTCSERLLTIALPSYSFHLFSPLTVTFPKLAVILRPLYSRFSYNTVCVPKNHRVMEFSAIKITGLMGKIRLVAEHLKLVQSRK